MMPSQFSFVQRRVPIVQKLCNHAAMMVLGLFLGAVVVAGWHGLGQGTQVQATATHGERNFAIATGYVEDGVEAIYFLDYLTGDLRAAVVSRRTGEFVAFFERNLQQDFSGASKNPRYLMVTGSARLPTRGVGNLNLASNLVYVAEAASGEVAAYGMPWNQTASAKGAAQRGGFVPIAKGGFRTTFVRDDD